MNIKNTISLVVVYFLLGLFAQNSSAQSKKINIDLTFSSIDENVSVVIPALKYDKDFAYSLTFDDALDDAFELAFRMFNGGLSEYNGKNYPGLYYTDGCSNKIPFTASVAWITANGEGVDIHNSVTSPNMTYSQALQMFRKDWTFLNHSYDHSSGDSSIDYIEQLTKNNEIFTSRVGQEMHYVIPPSGDTAYIAPAFSLNAHAVFSSKSYQSKLEPEEPTKIEDGMTDNNPVFWRNSVDTGTKISELLEQADTLFSELDQKIWWNDFTHGIGDEGPTGGIKTDDLETYMSYLESQHGYPGKDDGLFASSVEVFEYLKVRDNVNLSKSVINNNLSLEIDYSDCPDNLIYYDISLLIVGGDDLSNIQVPSEIEYSYALHKEGYLLNLKLPRNYLTTIPALETKTSDLKFFPNPTTNELYIKGLDDLKPLANLTITLVDGIGRSYLLSHQREIDHIYVSVPRNQLSSGLYWIIVRRDQEVIGSHSVILK